MSLDLSNDLREALHNEGTPLKLVDAVTGETFVVIPEATFAKAKSLLDEDAALAKAQLSSAALADFAKHHAPPGEWFEADEEDLFE
jgi:hypothetical protein